MKNDKGIEIRKVDEIRGLVADNKFTGPILDFDTVQNGDLLYQFFILNNESQSAVCYRIIEDKEFTDVAKRRELLISKPSFFKDNRLYMSQYTSIKCSKDTKGVKISCVLNTSQTKFTAFEIKIEVLDKRTDVSSAGDLAVEKFEKVKNFDGSSFQIQGQYIMHRTIDHNPANTQSSYINIYKQGSSKLYGQVLLDKNTLSNQSAAD